MSRVVGSISRCALGCAVTRRYDDFDLRIVFGNGVISRFAVTGAVGRDLTHCMFDLIEQWTNLGWVIDVPLCQHRCNDLELELELKLTPFHGHLIVLTEGVRSVQTAHPKAALSGAISTTDN